jgi:hypothetical protein
VAGAYDAVNEIDFLAALSECGRRIDAEISCLDGFFCADGYVTVHDAMAVDWDVTKSLCPDEILGSESQSAAYASYASTAPPRASTQRVSIAAVQMQGVASIQEAPGQFLVAAKGFKQPDKTVYDFLSDRLYGLDANGVVVASLPALTQDRYNGKLVRDYGGAVYQVNLERGLVRIADNEPIVAPRSILIDREDRYGGPATVSIGFQQTEDGSWGRPLLDAAFDAQGRVYAVPVVVDPALGKPYVAAAKLKLTDTGQGTDYSIEQIFDDPPAPNDNYVLTQLREVEVDQAGNVYVLNCHRDNSSDILWVYGSDGQLARRCELQDIGISAPTGLCISSDASKLYLASCENRPDANSVKLYVLSSQDLSLSHTIEIRNMGHITDIAEDPVTGTICVVGFQMPAIPSESQIQDADTILRQTPFYKPRVATVRCGDDGPIEAARPTGDATINDMALPLSVTWAGETIGSHNEAH